MKPDNKYAIWLSWVLEEILFFWISKIYKINIL